MSDRLLRFHFARHAVRGALVVLDDTMAELQGRRAYPAAVAGLLGEMLAAVAMIADGLKWQGSVALQSKGSQRLRTAMAEHRPTGKLRAIARPAEGGALDAGAAAEGTTPAFDPAAFAGDARGGLLRGDQLALSLLPAPDDPHSQPYQGLVGGNYDKLSDNLDEYFRVSEQLDTRFALYGTGAEARGLLLQRLPESEQASFVETDVAEDFWRELSLRMATVGPADLAFDEPLAFLRRLLAPEDLVVAPARAMAFECSCSQAKSDDILRTLGQEDLVELLQEREDVEVTCEFCGLTYRYDAMAVHGLFEPGAPTLH
ncbi:MAG: Hsp33 family molecular chaperone HslO [Pseudomonadota bacterium]